jgi:hypothetical protein
MWVLFKKTYSGPLGIFVAGIKQDIPKEIAEKLGKFCSPIVAPWDEKIDHKAIAFAEDKKNAVAAIEKTVALRQKVEELMLRFNDLSKVFKQAQIVEENARKLAVKATEKASDSDKSKKHITGLNRELKIRNFETQYVSGKFISAEADLSLAKLEAEDAEAIAAKLAEEAGIKFEPAKRISDSGGQAVSSPAEKSVSNKMN